MAANVQLMCQYWRNFDLLELQRELDTTATDLANRQDESEGSRKRLVDLSREFKKNTPEDIRKVVAPLLKSFQSEIDSLSKRSKAAEAAFLSVYKKLIDLPDPVSALEHAQSLQKKAHKVQDLEIENKQLRETLEEYNHEFAEVKNQEVTIKQLKEKLKEHEERVEATAKNRAKEKERELQRTFAEKERQLQETQLAVAKKLGEAEHHITSLHSALESVKSELFEVKAKYDEATSAKSDEMEIVIADLERANERATSAERQVERLKQQLALAAENLGQQSQEDIAQHHIASDQAMDILKRSTLEVELATKEKEIAQLVEDVQRLQASLSKLRETTTAQVAKLEEELTTKNLAFRVLEDKLRTQEDYEEVKRELRVLKSIEFTSVSTEEGIPEESKSLEVLLLEKNKFLQSENTHLKVVNSGLTDNTATGSQTISQTITTTTISSNTSSSTTKKSESSPSVAPSSSSLSPLLPSSLSSASVTAAVMTPLPTALAYSRQASVSSLKRATTTTAAVTTVSKLEANDSPPVIVTSASRVKQDTSLSSTPRTAPPPPDMDTFTSMAACDLPGNVHRVPSIPSSGRQYPVNNCKLSPDSPAPCSNGQPQSPITSLHSHLDPRHFAPPVSPFYPFPSSPFHPAFLPLNMVKSEVSSTSGVLDTGYVAKTVRELLSIHNIGQRLFAKHVLGLSQGTVSELLSKPKSWDKLTEKGRESYRKMHAWATDDTNIMALKAISPKKGTHPISSNNSYKEKEDTATEERIASILSEAQLAMNMKKSVDQQQVSGAVVSSIYHNELSRMSGTSPAVPVISPTIHPALTSPTGPHYTHELSRKIRDSDSRHHSNSSSHGEAASAQEMVTRIYRQELEKLKKAADAAGNIAASTMYAQELDRLNVSQHSHLPLGSSSSRPHHPFLSPLPEADFVPPSPLALDCRSTRPNGLKLKTEPPDSTSDEHASDMNDCGAIDLSKPSPQTGSSPSSSPTSESATHTGSAFFPVHPRVNGHDSRASESPQAATQKQAQGSTGGPPFGSVPQTECLSPLQRMQNIANSFASRPHMGLPNAKPLRAVLPPITQEEFDRYANMNTDDLVKKVKENLSQYSISQRLFGESVLGLSQGSVSDLLARPKPWHMLTQKGREPFIRMQIFLEDADSIPKLVASQYRVPPDKLMRSNSRGSNEPGGRLGHVRRLLQDSTPPGALALRHKGNRAGAQRRRKSSMEDKNFDSPTQPKRPRVFFTEDQKDSLRQAYNQDPYPNQGTIEGLAKNLNVGVKTVINWFHNHRMRAKQQHHLAGDVSIKSEPDESSNQSDISSMSGDVLSGISSGQFFHGGITPTDVNQWIFPQFEPMALKRKVPSVNEDNEEDNKENNGGLADDDDGDEMDEPDGLDASCSSHNNNNKEVDSGSSGGDVQQPESEDGESERTEGEDGIQKWAKSREDSLSDNHGSSAAAANGNNSCGVSRRKRSNPQRIYEGVQLEWSSSEGRAPAVSSVSEDVHGTPEAAVVHGTPEAFVVHGTPEAAVASNRELHPTSFRNSIETDNMSPHDSLQMNGIEAAPDVAALASAANNTECDKAASCSQPARTRHQSDPNVHRIQKIEKIQKAIKSVVEKWDFEEDGEKSSSIEKIQKHIETASTCDDWAF